MALWYAHDPLLELEWTLGNMLTEGHVDKPATQRRPTAPAPKSKTQAGSKPQQILSPTAQDLHWAVQAGRFDIVETADAFELVTDAPGFSQTDIAVEFHEGVLTISGKHQQHSDNQQPPSDEKQGQEQQQQPATRPQQEAGIKVWRRERCQYHFSRSFRLPDDVKAEDIAAHLDKGVLTVHVPKLPPAPKPQPRRITVQGAPAEAA